VPPYGRRGSSKIVEDRSEEIMGGIKNALERGQNLETAKKSFLNAGYTLEEVNLAAQKSNASPTRVVQTGPPPTQQLHPSPAQKPVPVKKTLFTKAAPAPQVEVNTVSGPKKKFSKRLVIAIITVSALILIGAAILGLYWDSIF
jgi:hypothetical protein